MSKFQILEFKLSVQNTGIQNDKFHETRPDAQLNQKLQYGGIIN